jgi:ketosteroid isomerase-like protein
MPDNNVEIYKRVIEAFNERGLEGALEYFDEEVEVYDPDLPESSVKGHDAVHSVLSQIVDAFEVMKVEEYEAIPVGDRVVGLIRTAASGEGRLGEMDVELHDAHVMTFRDGKITYLRLYVDQAEALADIGLDPSLADRRPHGDVPAP